MPETTDFLDEIRKSSGQRILFLPHAVRQMSRPERMISPAEIRKVIAEGRIIEDYPNDPRGHSCLMSGLGDADRPLHLVCAPKGDFLAVITAYVPDVEEWESDFSRRRKT